MRREVVLRGVVTLFTSEKGEQASAPMSNDLQPCTLNDHVVPCTRVGEKRNRKLVLGPLWISISLQPIAASGGGLVEVDIRWYLSTD